MNLMKECATQLMDLAGVDPNDCIVEMAKYAVAERLAKSDNFVDGSMGWDNCVSSQDASKVTACMARVYLYADATLGIDGSGRLVAHYDSRMNEETDVADLQVMVMSLVLDEANRIYENIARSIVNY